MTTQAAENRAEELGQVVSLNEAAKRLLSRSFEINLRSLNAIVQSKRSDGRLRGFAEASSQIRTWSRELHGQLERLGGLGREAVGLASLFLRQQRTVGLLGPAARSTGHPDAQRALAGAESALASHRASLRAIWRRIADVIDDLNQLGLMACVLSRTAMIEATAAEPAQRAQLQELTREFSLRSDEVVEIVRVLSTSARVP